jgi:hypothetical protein
MVAWELAGLTALALDTVKEAATKESGSTLAKWLNTDIGKAAEQVMFNASRRYLENYRARHGNLKIACVRMDKPMALEDIYTAVQLLDRADLHYFETVEALQDQYRAGGRRHFREGETQKQDGIAVTNREPYLMVLGGPGVGKSTFLRKVGLEALKQKQGAYRHPCIPVFVALQKFKTSDIRLEQLIVQEFADCGFPEPAAFTEAMLNKGRLLILLDGLDEVPLEQEAAVISQIKDFVDRHSQNQNQNQNQNRFIASCRVAAYKGGFPRFKDVAMAAFEEAQIQQFIRNWFPVDPSLDRAAEQTADQCWNLLQSRDYAAAKELAQTPLLLTLLCAVYRSYRDFPKNRAQLYGEALEVLLREWAAEKRIHDEPIYKEFSMELERGLLAEIAFDSFEAQQLFFGKRQVTRQIKEFLVNNLNAPKTLDSEQVLEAIAIQQGILVERARDAYSFSHLTFQEYLTAQHIVDNQQIDWLVTHHLDDDHWREVFLLVAGLMPGRKGADELLLGMERQAQTHLSTPKLKALVQWATAATEGSEGDYKPAAKRVRALDLALDLHGTLNLDLHRTLNLDLHRTLNLHSTFILACTLDLDRALSLARASALSLDRTLDLDLGLALALARTFALAFQEIKILKSINFDELIQRLEALQSQIPDNNQPLEARRAFVQRIQQPWFEALQIDPAVANLDKSEATALGKYLTAQQLMVRCQQSAVRVSPPVWAEIEARMVTVIDG